MQEQARLSLATLLVALQLPAPIRSTMSHLIQMIAGGRIWTINAADTLTAAGVLTLDNTNTGTISINDGNAGGSGKYSNR